MKSNRIRQVGRSARLGLFLLLMASIGFAQEVRSITAGEEAFRAAVYRQIVSGTVKANPEIPVINLLAEPLFTQGTANQLFWDFLGENLSVSWGTFKLRDCLIEVQSSSTPSFDEGTVITLPPDRYPRGSQVSISVEQPVGAPRYYRARLWVPGKSENPFENEVGEWSAVVGSTGDDQPPQLESFGIGGAAMVNGWFNSGSLNVRFSLQDAAGVSSARLSGAVSADTVFFTGVPVNEAPKSVSTVFPLHLNDGLSRIRLEACDAAYSPDSHGGSEKTPEVWKVPGNCGIVSPEIEIKVDTRPPEVDLSLIKSIYSSADVNQGTIELSVRLSDALSGVDTSSIEVALPGLTYTRRQIPQGSSLVLLITVTVPAQDGQFDLTVIAQDMAGNRVSASKTIRFIVEPPRYEAFRLHDPDWGKDDWFAPDAPYTNDYTVIVSDLKPAEGSKAADSIQVVWLEGKKSVTDPAPNGSFSFDLRRLNPQLTGKTRMTLQINGVDSFGNRQQDGPSRAILYDTTLPTLQSMSVKALISEKDDARNGSYDGYTRERRVLVTLVSAEKDLYRVLQTGPETVRRTTDSLQFFYEMPEPEGTKHFTFQAADSAGNLSNIVSAVIIYDRTIAAVAIEHFGVADTLKDPKSVLITFKNRELIPDLSRFRVNGALYRNVAEGSVVVPENSNGWWVSLIDFAGNETDSLHLTLPAPEFELYLSDASKPPDEADAGLTNEPLVKWKISRCNFRLENLERIIFHGAEGRSKSMPDAESGLLDLRELFGGLGDGGSYTVKAEAVVSNRPAADSSKWPSFTITYDPSAPAFTDFNLIDTTPEPFAALPGFSNDSVVRLACPSDDTDIRSIELDGTAGDMVEDQELPAVLSWKAFYEVKLSTGAALETHDVRAVLRDRAGNRSEEQSATIRYLKQDIRIPATLDSLVLSDTAADTALIQITAECPYPEFISDVEITYPDGSQKRLGRAPTLAEASGFLKVPDPQEGEHTLVLIDSAGNGSNKARLLVDIQEPPKVALTLYDYSEFPAFASPAAELPADAERSDSFYTNGIGGKLVAVTRLLQGDWATLELRALDGTLLYSGPVADRSKNLDVREIPLPTAQGGLVKISTIVQNRRGVADSASASLLLDVEAPQLLDVVCSRLTSERQGFRFEWKGSDALSGIAGLIVTETYRDDQRRVQRSQTRWLSANGTAGSDTLTLLNEVGDRTLAFFLVDQADADQNRPDSLAACAARGDFGWITHPSNVITKTVRYNSLEVSNFPNPFDPTKEVTKLILPINSDDGSTVRISIFDPFGNLVHKKEVFCNGRFAGGDSEDTPGLIWDGRNDRGELVADGGYICVIDVLKTGEQYKRKIAVVKKRPSW